MRDQAFSFCCLFHAAPPNLLPVCSFRIQPRTCIWSWCIFHRCCLPCVQFVYVWREVLGSEGDSQKSKHTQKCPAESPWEILGQMASLLYPVRDPSRGSVWAPCCSCRIPRASACRKCVTWDLAWGNVLLCLPGPAQAKAKWHLLLRRQILPF